MLIKCNSPLSSQCTGACLKEYVCVYMRVSVDMDYCRGRMNVKRAPVGVPLRVTRSDLRFV